MRKNTKKMNSNELTNLKITTSVMMKCAAELTPKGADPVELIKTAKILHSLYTEWLGDIVERMANLKNEAKP